MLAEFLEKLTDLTEKTHRAKVLKPEAEPTHRYAIQTADGELTWFDAQPQPRAHQPMDVETVCKLVENASKDGTGTVCVWYSREGVTVVFNDDERRDRATLKLTFSKTLIELTKLFGKAMNQKDFIRIMRTTFKECHGVGSSIITTLRSVKFMINQEGASDIGHQKSSVGKSMMAEIHGLQALPEYLTFFTPIFEQRDFVSLVKPIVVALEPDPHTQTFSLIEIPGEVEKAIQDAEDGLKEFLTVGECPVYYGKP